MASHVSSITAESFTLGWAAAFRTGPGSALSTRWFSFSYLWLGAVSTVNKYEYLVDLITFFMIITYVCTQSTSLLDSETFHEQKLPTRVWPEEGLR